MIWESQALALLTASLLRPLVLAAAAWLILRVLRVRHPASRHTVWSAVLVGMLLLPVATVIAPQWKLPLLPRREGFVIQNPLQASDTNDSNPSGLVASAVPSAIPAPAICIAATVGLTTQSPRRAPQPVVVAQLQHSTAAPPKPAQPLPAPRPKFDLVSVRRCLPGRELTGSRGGNLEEGGGGGRGPHYSPGRLRMQCMTVGAMMQMAYLGLFGDGDGLLNYRASIGDGQWLRKAPGWVNSDLYTVEGKTDDPAATAPNRPGRRDSERVLERMLQLALEDRFQLKLHSETEDVPMYNLTVAKGGLRLKPMAPEGCIAPDPSLGVVAPAGVFMNGEVSPAGKTPPCMIVLHVSGPDWALDAAGQKPGNLIGMLSKALNRHVFDKTGITDLYTFHLRFAHDEATPGNLPPGMIESMFPHTDVPSGPSVFTALEGLGLKLEPTRGPQGHFVIDHIERPSEN